MAGASAGGACRWRRGWGHSRAVLSRRSELTQAPGWQLTRGGEGGAAAWVGGAYIRGRHTRLEARNDRAGALQHAAVLLHARTVAVAAVWAAAAMER